MGYCSQSLGKGGKVFPILTLIAHLKSITIKVFIRNIGWFALYYQNNTHKLI
jgi:hypothetical protein